MKFELDEKQTQILTQVIWACLGICAGYLVIELLMMLLIPYMADLQRRRYITRQVYEGILTLEMKAATIDAQKDTPSKEGV